MRKTRILASSDLKKVCAFLSLLCGTELHLIYVCHDIGLSNSSSSKLRAIPPPHDARVISGGCLRRFAPHFCRTRWRHARYGNPLPSHPCGPICLSAQQVRNIQVVERRCVARKLLSVFLKYFEFQLSATLTAFNRKITRPK